MSLTAVWCMDSFHSFHGPAALPSACRWASAWPAQTSRPWVDGSSSRNASPLSRLKVVVFPARPRPTKQRRTTGNGAAPSFCFSTASSRKRSSSSGGTCRSAALLEQDPFSRKKADCPCCWQEKALLPASIQILWDVIRRPR